MNRRWFLKGLAVTATIVVAGVSAEARMHAPYRGHRIIPANAAPLDGFTQPSGAYSFRKLISAYAGPAMRIRRASDNAELDIGFVGAVWNEAAATVHCAATTCFVVTKYDQSDNARDWTAGPAAQPQLILGCQNGIACMETTSGTIALLGASVTPATGVVSFSAVANRTAGIGACNLVRQNGGANRLGTSTTAAAWRVLGGTSGSVVASGVADNAWHAAQAVVNGAGSVINVDGTETTGTATGNVAGSTPGLTGATSTTCRHAEEIFWDAYTLTPAERTALTNNQRNFWMPAPLDAFTTPSGAYSFRKLKSTYTGPAMRIRRASDNAEIDINFLGCTPFTGCPWDAAAATAHCASTTCFGRAWYDQSGNARDFVQATTASQLQLIFNCDGTLPCWRATVNTQTLLGTSFTPASGVVSFSAVANRTVAGTGACIFLRENGTANRIQSSTTAGQWQVTGGTSGSVSAAASDAAWHAAVGAVNGASSYLNIDGASTTGTATGNTAAAGPGILGSATGTCDFGEAMWWDAYVVTAPEAAALIANQRSFWGTP